MHKGYSKRHEICCKPGLDFKLQVVVLKYLLTESVNAAVVLKN